MPGELFIGGKVQPAVCRPENKAKMKMFIFLCLVKKRVLSYVLLYLSRNQKLFTISFSRMLQTIWSLDAIRHRWSKKLGWQESNKEKVYNGLVWYNLVERVKFNLVCVGCCWTQLHRGNVDCSHWVWHTAHSGQWARQCWLVRTKEGTYRHQTELRDDMIVMCRNFENNTVTGSCGRQEGTAVGIGHICNNEHCGKI